MPNWADDEGRFHWQPPGKAWYEQVEIPHAPISEREGCFCAFCNHRRLKEGRLKLTKAQLRLLKHAAQKGGSCKLYRAENIAARNLQRMGLGTVRRGRYLEPSTFIINEQGREAAKK